MCDIFQKLPKTGGKINPDRHILFPIFVALIIGSSSASGVPITSSTARNGTVSDTFHVVRMMTSRVLITVEGRDQSRHLTTYHMGSNPTSELNFGFPARHERKHAEERMEIFDVDALSSNARGDIRRITLRHPWQDLFMTSDDDNNVRACVYRGIAVAQTNSFVCRDPPYIYIEKARNSSAGTNNAYKMRFLLNAGGAIDNLSLPPTVAYIQVTQFSWEPRFRTQLGLVTQALGIGTKKAWDECLRLLFDRQVRLFEARRKKHGTRLQRRRCQQTPITVRDQLIRGSDTEYFKRELRNALRFNNECLQDTDRAYKAVNKFRLTASKPWKTMTLEERTMIVSCVGQVVCTRLHHKLLELAEQPCFRKRRWGKMSLRKRVAMLQRHLTVGWLQRKIEIDNRLIESVDKYLDAKTTTFLFRQ